MSFQASALLLAWIAIALLALAMSGLIRQVRALSVQPRATSLASSPLVGQPFPLPGDPGVGWSGGTRVVLFVTADCEVCQTRLAELEAIAREDGGGLAFAAMFSGSANGFRSEDVEAVPDQGSVLEQFGMPATPFGVVVRPSGVIAHAEVIGSTQALRSLVRAARSEP
jgi:hypothetical protein